jgi:hypothetical protein
MSYKPRSLFSLVEDVKQNRLFLPHIQRPFVWERSQMCKLFDSLMRSYPVQTFLFWKTKDAIKARRFMTSLDLDADLSDLYDKSASAAHVSKTFVLDGQQRLQTLYTLFAGDALESDATLSEAWANMTDGAAVGNEGIMHELEFRADSPGTTWYRLRNLLEGDAQRNAEELADEFNEALDKSLSESPEDRKARHKRVRHNFAQLIVILRQEQFLWIQELDGVANHYPYKKILDVFVRVNSGGTKLDAADLMFAAMKEQWSDIEEKIEEVAEILTHGSVRFEKDFVLKCLVVVQDEGAELDTQKFSGPQSEQLLHAMEVSWPKAEIAFKKLADFLEHDLKLYSDKSIRTYNAFVPLFDYLFNNPTPSEKDKALMRGFHYKAQMFGWFRSQTDSVINRLHTRVKGAGAFPMALIKEYFANRGDSVTLTKYHIEENRLRQIILNMVYVQKLGVSPFNVRFKGNEPHIDHIYPQHALRTQLGMSSSLINRIGNFRFIGATDNIRKRAEPPASYFSRLKNDGIDVLPHLLVDEFASDPLLLKLDEETYDVFVSKRTAAILGIAEHVVNPEMFHGAPEQDGPAIPQADWT